MPFLSDTFTETSDTALGSHTPDVGGTWTVFAGGVTAIGAEERARGDSAETGRAAGRARASTAVAARLATMGTAGAAGAKVAAVAASLGAGLGIGSLANQVVYSDRERASGLQTNAFSRAYWSDFTTAVRQAITDGFSDAPSSNAAVHAATVRTTPTASP